MQKKQKHHYIDGKKFLRRVVVQKNKYNLAKKNGTLETFEQDPYVLNCYILLNKRIATKYNFSGYSYIDEMISEGIMNCFLYWHNFNPDKTTNVFAYFTTVSSQAFIRYIKKEKKQTMIKEQIALQKIIDNTESMGHNNFLEKYIED